MERRFSIRGSTGPALRSSTGCAEGCALSVVGMLAINLIIDAWMTVKVPTSTLWSYVDNIEVTASNSNTALTALRELTRVTQALDIHLDSAKTTMWSNHAPTRKELRDAQQKVIPWARDLGGHVQYTAQPTNCVITTKIKNFLPRWKDFARSLAPYRQKLKAVKMVAWPNVLHGITSVHLAETHFDTLRTQAMRGLDQHGLGVSPIVHLSLVEPPANDPGFHALWKTVTDVRTYLLPEACEQILATKAHDTDKLRPSPGPVSVLLHRLYQIGWHWDATFWDHRGFPVDFWQCPIQELRQRITQAWQQRAQGLVIHRKTMKDITLTSPYLTTKAWPSDTGDQGLLRTALNGTFFAQERQHHVAEQTQTTTCVFCGEEDSQYHRHWTCRVSEPARKQCPQHIRDKIPHLPIATTAHGWVPTPAALDTFQAMLHQLPDVSDIHEQVDSDDNILDLFTDGTCLTPQDPLSRLAAWGFVQSISHSPPRFAPIAHGIVPGLVQTITRAELLAAKSALLYARKTGKPFRLWIDNALVVKHLRHVLEATHWESLVPSNKVPNHDLITDIMQLLGPLKPRCRGITKVSSHQSYEGARDDCDLWVWAGNDAADRCASQAFTQQPKLLQVHAELCQQIRELTYLRQHLHDTIITVGRLALRMIHQQESTEQHEPLPDPLSKAQMTPWTLPESLPPAAQVYDLPEWKDMSRWIASLHDSAEPTQRWSFHQLLIDLRFHCNASPWYHPKLHKWGGFETCPTATYPKLLRWFKTYLNRVAIACGNPLPVTLSRPDSCAILYWCQTVVVRASFARTARIDQWMLTWRPGYRQPTALQDIVSLPCLS
eukprot:Skav224503  [mRNA]  locus=scaffold1478:227093:229585:- [translate_table: standard]